jgi:Ni/Co efflux regulator RcnB
MNRSVILAAVVAMSLAMPGFSFAEGQGDRHDEHAQESERGAGPNHSYHKGDRLPAAEHSRQYEVTDWRSQHLREPPPGHHWVRSGDDFVLAAIATGVIADIALHH